MTTMNKELACKILNISIDYDESLLRKKYKLACLKYHPDKNIDNQSHNDFIKVKEAYDFLLNDLNNSKQNFDVLNHFDTDTLHYYVSILDFLKKNIDFIINPVVDHLKKFEYYELHPTLEQLFNKSLYILDDLYIPLWHHDITIKNYHIKIIPDIPDYIDIDIDNNIHVYLTITQDIPINFNLCGISFLIDGNKTFKGCGIPIIQEKIYDISILSDVIFHIT